MCFIDSLHGACGMPCSHYVVVSFSILAWDPILYITNFLVLYSSTACRLSGQGCSSASSDFTVPIGYQEWRIHSFSCGKNNMFLWWNITKVVGHPRYFVGLIYKEPSSPTTHLVGYISIYIRLYKYIYILYVYIYVNIYVLYIYTKYISKCLLRRYLGYDLGI
jgi:hypothetical protein